MDGFLRLQPSLEQPLRSLETIQGPEVPVSIQLLIHKPLAMSIILVACISKLIQHLSGTEKDQAKDNVFESLQKNTKKEIHASAVSMLYNSLFV